MAYDVELHDDVEAYLRGPGLGLSDAGRGRLRDRVKFYLGEHGDSLRSEPSRRLGHESYRFDVTVIFQDPDTLVWQTIRLVVDDSCAGYGVLRVVWAEAIPGEPPPPEEPID